MRRGGAAKTGIPHPASNQTSPAARRSLVPKPPGRTGAPSPYMRATRRLKGIPSTVDVFPEALERPPVQSKRPASPLVEGLRALQRDADTPSVFAHPFDAENQAPRGGLTIQPMVEEGGIATPTKAKQAISTISRAPKHRVENLKVAVRCRPFNAEELKTNGECIVRMDEKHTYITDPRTGEERQFLFDHNYFWDVGQARVHGDIGVPILLKALEGYNATIMSYGQTSSGKTYTMMGMDQQGVGGLIPSVRPTLPSPTRSSPRRLCRTCSRTLRRRRRAACST